MLIARRRHRARQITGRLYQHAVEQARHPDFYTRVGVADTLDGRFDMVALHVTLIGRRLAESDDDRLGRQAERALQEYFFDDMDRSLREMGVGDLSVGKQIRKMAQAFFGRQQAYAAALDSDDEEALSAALRRNFAVPASQSGIADGLLADYVLRSMAMLRQIPDSAMADQAWRPDWPAVEPDGDHDAHPDH